MTSYVSWGFVVIIIIIIVGFTARGIRIRSLLVLRVVVFAGPLVHLHLLRGAIRFVIIVVRFDGLCSLTLRRSRCLRHAPGAWARAFFFVFGLRLDLRGLRGRGRADIAGC